MSIRLSNEQYEFIKGEVVAIFERYDVRCIPISGFELALKMGVKLIPYSFLNNEKRLAVMRLSQMDFIWNVVIVKIIFITTISILRMSE